MRQIPRTEFSRFERINKADLRKLFGLDSAIYKSIADLAKANAEVEETTLKQKFETAKLTIKDDLLRVKLGINQRTLFPEVSKAKDIKLTGDDVKRHLAVEQDFLTKIVGQIDVNIAYSQKLINQLILQSLYDQRVEAIKRSFAVLSRYGKIRFKRNVDAMLADIARWNGEDIKKAMSGTVADKADSLFQEIYEFYGAYIANEIGQQLGRIVIQEFATQMGGLLVGQLVGFGLLLNVEFIGKQIFRHSLAGLVSRQFGGSDESNEDDRDDVLKWIADQLAKFSPVGGSKDRHPGLFRDATSFLLADGAPIDVRARHIATADFYEFVNPLPYARKIESGSSSSAPDGVYQAVATLAKARFHGVKIYFQYRALDMGDVDHWARSLSAARFAASRSQRSESLRPEWLRRQPSIAVEFN